MKYLFLDEVISEKITGDWGDEGDKVNVLRTTNFTNDGVIDYSNVVTRNIPEKVIKRKKLVQGDVIIEKSGGSPSQPVGRVVYFERKDLVFLCNNFTAILRSNDLVFPKYLFYFLFSLHKLGVTLKFQNKTTGIINLQLDKYLDRIKIPLPPLPEQKRIADILDKADALRQKNKQLLATYDELLQATFLDMFGDPVTNSKRWKIKSIKEIGKVVTGNTPPRVDLSNYGNHIEWIKTDNIGEELIYPTKSREYLSESGMKKGRAVSVNSILVTCIAGSISSIGNCVLTDRVVAFNQQINAIVPKICNPLFVYSCMQYSKRGIQIGATQGMKKIITKSNFEKLPIIYPPITLQNQFAKIAENIESQKALVNQSLQESEDLFNGLVQKAFNDGLNQNI